jgi:PAS domain S-box-containing protein
MANDEHSFDYSGFGGSSGTLASSASLHVATSRRSMDASTLSLWAATAATLNPNKAVLSLDADMRVALVNDIACHMLGYPCDKLVGMTLDEIVVREKEVGALEEEEELQLASTGKRVMFSGKVVDVRTGDGQLLAASLWLKLLEGGRKVAVLEQVERTVGKMSVSKDGLVSGIDSKCALIFQGDVGDFVGLNISALIPSVNADSMLQEKVKDNF